jgi:hypothetical protein
VRTSVLTALSFLAIVALSGCPTPQPPPQAVRRPPESQLPPGIPPECASEPVAVPILPRTSNDEFRQLVSDLLGAPVDAALFARWTPLAQVRGFDNMTESRIDAQTLEEQLTTTEELASLLVRTPSVMSLCPAPTDAAPLCTVHASYDATAQFSGVQGQDCWSYLDGASTPLTFDDVNQRWIASDPGLFIWNTGLHPGIGIDVVRRWIAPQDGAVTLRGSFADVDAGGGDGIAVLVRAPVAGVVSTVFSAVIVNGGAAESFEVPLDVRRGDAVDLVVQRAANNSYDSTALTATFDFAPAPPSGGLSWDNCGSPVVERIASRAFRRPLRSDELVDLKEVFDETSASATTAGIPAPFFEGLEAALQAALLSPNVLYKPEFVPGGFDPATENGFRRASRLALYFRSSFPDDELWALASAGALDDDTLRAQAERLLSVDTERDRFVDSFAGQWLNFRGLLGTPATPLQTSMRREGHDVFATVLAEDLPPQRLIAPGFTIVDGPLAAHYGLDAANGIDPTTTEPVRVETSERGGLFTQAHFLSTAAGSEFKRVIHRGIYALNRTLCTSVPMLDPATLEEIQASVGSIDPSLPLGERMQMHRSSSERCLDCHGLMDPLGLSLEHFDQNGQWRDTYPDGSVINNEFQFNDVSVANPDELASFVSGSEDYRRCVAEKLVTFGLHRAPGGSEYCAIDALGSISADGESRSLHDIAIDAFLVSLHFTEAP